MSKTSTTATATAAVAATRAGRMIAVKAEMAAWRIWDRNGRNGTEPQTPNMDSIRNEEEMTTTTASTKAPKAARIAVRFYSNGTPLGDHSNTLAHVAVRSTPGVGKGGAKLNSAELQKLLVKNGIESVRSTWAFELPNGKVIGAVVAGDEIPALLAAAPKSNRKPKAAKPKAPKVTVEQFGARSFGMMVDGVQVGNRHRSLNAAKAATESI